MCEWLVQKRRQRLNSARSRRRRRPRIVWEPHGVPLTPNCRRPHSAPPTKCGRPKCKKPVMRGKSRPPMTPHWPAEKHRDADRPGGWCQLGHVGANRRPIGTASSSTTAVCQWRRPRAWPRPRSRVTAHLTTTPMTVESRPSEYVQRSIHGRSSTVPAF